MAADDDEFLRAAREIKAEMTGAPASPPPRPPVDPPSTAPSGDWDQNRDRNYAIGALRGEMDRVSLTGEGGRNHALNVAMFNLHQFVIGGQLSRDEVWDGLVTAARRSGLEDPEIRATLLSGEKGAEQKVGARTIPEPTERPGTEVALRRPTSNESQKPLGFEGGQPAADEPADTPEDEERDLHAIAVRRRAYDLRVNDEARILWAAQQAVALGQRAPLPIRLTDFLAHPDEDAVYRIDGLLPTGGRALLAAQYKAGKTTLIANLLRALADGVSFLGAHQTHAVGRVVLMDTELDERMLRRWLRTQNIRHTDAIDIVSLRGKLGTFNIIDDASRAQWAERISGADLIVLDCLRPCLDALGLSEDKDAGRFLVAFDALISEAKAGEAVVVHHMGHSGERSRGDSRLLDWPDVLWKIVRDTREDSDETDDAGARYFSAMGRDVMVAESLLDYTAADGSLMAVAGNRIEHKAAGGVELLADIMAAPDAAGGLTHNQVVARLKAYGIGRNVARTALQKAIDDRVIVCADGPRHSRIHTLNPSYSKGA